MRAQLKELRIPCALSLAELKRLRAASADGAKVAFAASVFSLCLVCVLSALCVVFVSLLCCVCAGSLVSHQRPSATFGLSFASVDASVGHFYWLGVGLGMPLCCLGLGVALLS